MATANTIGKKSSASCEPVAAEAFFSANAAAVAGSQLRICRPRKSRCAAESIFCMSRIIAVLVGAFLFPPLAVFAEETQALLEIRELKLLIEQQMKRIDELTVEVGCMKHLSILIISVVIYIDQ